MKSAQDALSSARDLAEREDWAAAVEVLQSVEPTAEVLDRLAFYLSLSKQYDLALDALAAYRKLRPDDARGYYSTGYQYYRQQRFRECLPWFEQAFDKQPEHLRARLLAMVACRRLGRAKEAVVIANDIVRIWNELAPGRRTEARAFAQACYVLGRDTISDRPDLALEYFEAADKAQPNDAWFLWGKARALNALHRHPEALEALDRAAQLKPSDPWIELERARAVGATGDQARARDVLKRFLSRSRSWEAERAGQVARQLGESELAVEFFTRAASDPGSRGNPRVLTELKAARAAAGLPDAPDDGLRWGRIRMVQAERNFGFLVDEIDGVDRHFRLRPGQRVAVGDRIRFRPVVREKGPAAELIQDAGATRFGPRRRRAEPSRHR